MVSWHDDIDNLAKSTTSSTLIHHIELFILYEAILDKIEDIVNKLLQGRALCLWRNEENWAAQCRWKLSQQLSCRLLRSQCLGVGEIRSTGKRTLPDDRVGEHDALKEVPERRNKSWNSICQRRVRMAWDKFFFLRQPAIRLRVEKIRKFHCYPAILTHMTWILP